MLSKRKKGHQYPPRERTRLLCRQKESNTQKQRLKEKEKRKGARKRTKSPVQKDAVKGERQGDSSTPFS